jgi:ribonuclease HI
MERLQTNENKVLVGVKNHKWFKEAVDSEVMHQNEGQVAIALIKGHTQNKGNEQADIAANENDLGVLCNALMMPS